MEDDAPSRTARPSRPLRTGPTGRRTLGVIALCVLVIVGWAAMAWRTAQSARVDATRGRDRLVASEPLSLQSVATGDLRAELADARADLEAAQDSLGSIWLRPAEIIPVLDTQFASARALNSSALEVIDIGLAASMEAEQILSDPPRSGPQRLEVLGRVETLLDRSVETVRDLDLGPNAGLAADLHTARASFASERDTLLTQLEAAQLQLDRVSQILRGPRTYLLLAANNAEMRAGSGLGLFTGLVTFAEGDAVISDLRSTGDNVRDVTRPITDIDPDYALFWGHASPDRDLRSVALSPRFDVTGDLASRLWERGGETPVDGVLSVDPVTISHLLSATGPVEVDGGLSLDETNATEYLLRGQYLDPRFENFDTDAQYPLIVEAVVSKLFSSDTGLIELSHAVSRSIAGRHLLAWSSRSDDQELWESIGIDGLLHEDSLAVSILNAGANKADFDLQVDAEILLGDPPGPGDVNVTIRLELDNTNPTPGLPQDTTVRGVSIQQGDYVGTFAISLPAAARAIDFRGAGPIVRLGRDGPTQMVTTNRFVIRAGSSSTFDLSFVLPAKTLVEIESSARVPPIRYRFDDVIVDDIAPLRLDPAAGTLRDCLRECR